MAFTHWYVAPTSGSDSTGDGSSGNPYATIQKVLDTETPTGEDQINVKEGETLTLTAAHDFTTWGNPGEAGALLIRGYTSTADDGGIADIDCNGNAFISDAALDGIHIADAEIYGSGSGVDILLLDDGNSLYNCYFHDCKDITLGSRTVIALCYITDCAGEVTCAEAHFNALKDGSTHKFTTSALIASTMARGNILSLSSDTDGIELGSDGASAIGNTIWANAGSGYGVINSASSREVNHIINNYVEGFSALGGHAFTDAGGMTRLLLNNHYYNCLNVASITGIKVISDANNGWNSLGSSGLTDPANDDFTPTSMLKDLALPTQFNANFGGPQNNYAYVGAVVPEVQTVAGDTIINSVKRLFTSKQFIRQNRIFVPQTTKIVHPVIKRQRVSHTVPARVRRKQIVVPPAATVQQNTLISRPRRVM